MYYSARCFRIAILQGLNQTYCVTYCYQVSATDTSDITTSKIRLKDMSPLSGVSSDDYVSLIPFDKNHGEPITPRILYLSPLLLSYASYECATPYAKKERCAKSLSPVINVRTIASLQPYPGIKYGGMSFEAASPSPISMLIPTLEVPLYSIIFQRIYESAH